MHQVPNPVSYAVVIDLSDLSAGTDGIKRQVHLQVQIMRWCYVWLIHQPSAVSICCCGVAL